jgi:hypothetical protein
MLMPHSINHGNACFAYFNKIWGIPFRGELPEYKVPGVMTISRSHIKTSGRPYN